MFEECFNTLILFKHFLQQYLDVLKQSLIFFQLSAVQKISDDFDSHVVHKVTVYIEPANCIIPRTTLFFYIFVLDSDAQTSQVSTFFP